MAGPPTAMYSMPSVGIVFDFDQFSAQLSWVGINSVNTPYPTAAPRNKNGAVLVLSWSF